MGGAQGGEEVGFGGFVHFAFYHHDVVVGGAYHEFHVGFLHLLEGGVDHKLAVDACNAHLGDWTVEGDVAHGESCRGGETGEAVGGIDAVGGVEGNIHEGVGVVVVGEERTEHAVDKTRCEDFIVAGAAFAFEETAGETAGGGELFFVFNLQGHEVHALAGFLGRDHGGKEHGVAHANFNRSIGLLGELAGLDGDGPAVGQRDGFLDGIHKVAVNILFFLE